MKEIPFIPFHVPAIGEEEIEEVVATLRSGWLTTGPRTRRFEEDFKEYVGADYALAVNSGTAAMHLALAGLGIGPGDEVITTPLTFCATVNTIIHMGATPVLADIGANGNIDPRAIANRITSKTRAIMPVHYGGLPCDMDAIWKLAQEHGLKVIEDAAHATGTHYRGTHVGSQESKSDAVAFSFYATKNMTTAEGGMVTCKDPGLGETMRQLALHGINRDAWNRYTQNGNWYYDVTAPGFKYNLTDLQSAIGIHQLRKVEAFTGIRTARAKLYNQLLEDVAEVECPADSVDGRHSWHLYPLRLNLSTLTVGRDEFIQELKGAGIGVSVHFIPIPLLTFFAPWAEQPEQQCPRALMMYQRLISLPLYPNLSEADVARVANSVKDIVARFRKATVVPIDSARTISKPKYPATAAAAAGGSE